MDQDLLMSELEKAQEASSELGVQVATLQDQLDGKQEEIITLESALDKKSLQLSQTETKLEGLQAQHEEAKAVHEAALKDLRAERDTAQQQLADFVNKTSYEKESLEGRLQHQVNQTLA